MKFTRTDIMAILRAYGLDDAKARRATGQIIDTLASSLAAGQPVEIRGLGSFEVKERKARKARNPKTGEAVEVPPRQRIFFRPGRELKISLSRNNA